jgi:hypothetical protein
MSDATQELERLKRLLVMFTGGAEEDVSVRAAQEIEGCIAQLVDDDDELMEFADDLAQYRPEGGEYLYSYADMRPKAQAALNEVRRRLG